MSPASGRKRGFPRHTRAAPDGGKRSRFIDLSRSLEDGMRGDAGMPAVSVSAFATHDKPRRRLFDDTGVHQGIIRMAAASGTCLEAPFRRYPDESDVAELPLERVADLPGLVVDWHQQHVPPQAFADLDLEGKAVLINTGWGSKWGERRYFEEHPVLDVPSAHLLRTRGAALVGIDSPDVDDLRWLRRPALSCLLGSNIPVVKNLARLDQLPRHHFRFFAVPAKVVRLGAFPVRAFALLG